MRPGHDQCEAACYDCLMSYRNQPDHPLLDRATVIPVLQQLATAAVTLRPDAESVEALVESELEKQWLEWLRERGLREPDRGQVLIEDRSEEHTSELQSLMRISYAVFCLTKKKKNRNH